jgi:hypothetical protein
MVGALREQHARLDAEQGHGAQALGDQADDLDLPRRQQPHDLAQAGLAAEHAVEGAKT